MTRVLGCGAAQPVSCCSSRVCGSGSTSRASPRGDLAGFGASPKPALVPRSATSALRCRSVEVSLLASDLHVKSCRLYCNGEGGLSINGALSSAALFSLS